MFILVEDAAIILITYVNYTCYIVTLCDYTTCEKEHNVSWLETRKWRKIRIKTFNVSLFPHFVSLCYEKITLGKANQQEPG